MGDSGPLPNIEYFKDDAGEWRWRAKAANGNIVATSGEGYKRLAGAINGFHSFQQIAANPVVEVEDDDAAE